MALPDNLTLNREYEKNYEDDVVQAVASVAASEPSAYVGKLWFDTNSALLKVCTAHNGTTASWTACKA